MLFFCEFVSTFIGTSDKLTTGLKAPTPKIWLYVWRCAPNTTTDEIKEHMHTNWSGHTIGILKLTTKDNDASFRISTDTDNDLLKSVYEPSN